MNLILFGAGTYFIGKDSFSMAPLGCAIIEAYNQKLIQKLYIVTSSPNTAKKAAEKFNNFCRDDVATGCDKSIISKLDPDKTCAIISVPDNLHYSILKSCADYHINSLVVKPFVEKLEQGRELTNIFQEKGLLGCVEFHKRFDESNRLIKEKIKNSETKISRIFIDYSQPKSMPLINFKKWTESSNIFQYLGVHYVDLIYWITGYQPQSCSVYKSGNMLSSNGVNTPDNIDVIIKWTNKNESFNSIHLTSWAESDKQPFISRQKIEVLTNEFRIDSDQSSRGFSIQQDEGFEIINPYFCQKIGLNRTNLSAAESEYAGYGVASILVFLKFSRLHKEKNISLQKIYNSTDLCSFEQALVSTKVVQSVNDCLRNGIESAEIF